MKYSTHVWLRCITAVIGGYAISTSFSIALVPVFTQWLNVSLSASVLTATMLCYLCYFTIIILSFCLPTLKRLWQYLSLFCILLFVLYQGASPTNLYSEVTTRTTKQIHKDTL